MNLHIVYLHNVFVHNIFEKFYLIITGNAVCEQRTIVLAKNYNFIVFMTQQLFSYYSWTASVNPSSVLLPWLYDDVGIK